MRSLHKTLRFIACIYPIVIHIVIILNFMSYFIGVDFTGIVYPIFGHPFHLTYCCLYFHVYLNTVCGTGC